MHTADSPGETFLWLVFRILTWLFLTSEEHRSSVSLGLAAILFWGAVVFPLGVTSWLQYRSFSLLTQILHPASADFLASMSGLWPFWYRSLTWICMRHCCGILNWAWSRPTGDEWEYSEGQVGGKRRVMFNLWLGLSRFDLALQPWDCCEMV